MSPNAYQALKDFAGPCATVIASMTAAGITYVFAIRQLQIARAQVHVAKQQARTAHDQLRNNLFERRYAIFLKTQDLIRTILNKGPFEDFSPLSVIEYHMVIEEAGFLFSPHCCQWLNELWHGAVTEYFKARINRQSPDYLKAELRLLAMFEELPKRFRADLEFSELTRPKRD